MSQQTQQSPDFRAACITQPAYASAIGTLIEMARKDCGGSRVCAQVLLSAYNGCAFQLDITDLCLLDDKLYPAALVVIRGRVELRIEPHELIPDGGKVFERLWDQWIGYHVSNRFHFDEAA